MTIKRLCAIGAAACASVVCLGSVRAPQESDDVSETFKRDGLVKATQNQMKAMHDQIRQIKAELRASRSLASPVGSIVAWHKKEVAQLIRSDENERSREGGVVLEHSKSKGAEADNEPFGLPGIGMWAECNGQSLKKEKYKWLVADIQMPDLNNPVKAGLKGRFLRGHTTSGHLEEGDLKKHDHPRTFSETHEGDGNLPVMGGASGRIRRSPTQPTGGAETRPTNMSVVWIMRIN